jgi:hypothetical protein
MREVEELSLRSIAWRPGLHRDTIKKMLAEGAPPSYWRTHEPVLTSVETS